MHQQWRPPGINYQVSRAIQMPIPCPRFPLSILLAHNESSSESDQKASQESWQESSRSQDSILPQNHPPTGISLYYPKHIKEGNASPCECRPRSLEFVAAIVNTGV